MPRTKEQFLLMQDESKQKILFTALRLFVKKGMGVSVQEIAKAAGISKGLIYHYYESKEALILAIIEFGAKSSSQAVGYFTEQTEVSAKEKILKMSQFMVETLQSHDITALFFLFMVQVSLTYINDTITEMLQHVGFPIELLTNIIQIGQQEQTVKKGDPMELAILYWATIEGLSCFKIAGMPLRFSVMSIAQILLKEEQM